MSPEQRAKKAFVTHPLVVPLLEVLGDGGAAKPEVLLAPANTGSGTDTVDQQQQQGESGGMGGDGLLVNATVSQHFRDCTPSVKLAVTLDWAMSDGVVGSHLEPRLLAAIARAYSQQSQFAALQGLLGGESGQFKGM